MAQGIQRRFVQVTGRFGVRRVHYRVGGQGPLVLLLHQSPQSSRELVPLMHQWSADFTLLAPDTPGYGLSDPLGPDEATLDDFATATLEFADALGARRFGVYGFHTGGMIGLALADGHPDRVCAAACNGVLVPTAAERASLLAHYLPRLVPRWDGSHLAWLWARNREQNVFFPWHERSRATRMDFPMAPPERQQAGVLEFLRAAAHYHVAYRGAFIYAADTVAERLKVPTLITAARWDPLCPHLQRLPRPARGVTVGESADPAEAQARCRTHLLEHRGDAPTVPLPPQPGGVELGPAIVETSQGSLLLRSGGSGTDLPVLCLHGAGGSSRTLMPWLASLARSRLVLAPDLPGHGEWEAATGDQPCTPADWVAAMAAVLAAAGARRADLLAEGAGTLVALELLAADPGRWRRVVLLDPPVADDELRRAFRAQGLPSLAADWHGGHLSRCWHMVRDRRLYFPWFRRDQQAIRWCEPDLDEARIHLEVVEFLKSEGAWQSLLAAALDCPWPARLSAAGPAVQLAATETGAWRAAVEKLAGDTGHRLHLIPDAPAARAAALLALLAGDPA